MTYPIDVKNTLLGLGALLILGGGFWLFNNYIYNQKQQVVGETYESASYVIEGARVQLKDGVAEKDGVETRIFGNEVITDLDADGDADIAFILTQSHPDGRIAFYATAALQQDGGYVGIDGYPLGDHIAPQSTNMSTNPRHVDVVVFNFATRAPGETIDVRPSVGKSVYLKVDTTGERWAIVEPDFEGEAQ